MQLNDICNMKAVKKKSEKLERELDVIELFNDYFQQRMDEKKQEKQTLIDRFNIHLKGKKIILDNSNS